MNINNIIYNNRGMDNHREQITPEVVKTNDT